MIRTVEPHDHLHTDQYVRVAQLARAVQEMLDDEEACTVMARNAQRRVHHDFLIFMQIRNLLETLVACRR